MKMFSLWWSWLVLLILPLAGRAVPFEVSASQLSLCLVPGFNHRPLEVKVTSTDPAFDLSTLSVASDASWVTATASPSTGAVSLSFNNGALTNSSYTATVAISSGTDTRNVLVNGSLAPLSIFKLVDDPFRSRTYGIQINGAGQGAVVALNPITGERLGSVSVGNRPTALCVSNNGAELFVLNCIDKSISVVDLEGLKISETIPLTLFDSYAWGTLETTANLATGPDDILYYTDAAWYPNLRVFKRSTKTVLQTLLIKPDSTYGFGDFALNSSKTKLFGWAQGGWTAGWAGSYASSFNVSSTGTLTHVASTSELYPTVMMRDPVETPVLISADDSKVFIKQLVLDATNIGNTLGSHPSPVYSISPGGEIAVTQTAAYETATGLKVLDLPVSTTVHAVTSDYARLVYFDPVARSLGTLPLIASIGPDILGRHLTPAPGSIGLPPSSLHWTPIPGVDLYRIYLGTGAQDVANATQASPEYLGQSSQPNFTLSTPLAVGVTYHWRVDAVSAFETTPGEVRSFTVSLISSSVSRIETTTVQGHPRHRFALELQASLPEAWQVTANASWVSFGANTGVTPSTLEVLMDASGLAAGLHTATLTFSNAGGTLFTLPLRLKVEPMRITLIKSDPLSRFAYAVSEDTTPQAQAYLLEIDTQARTLGRVVPVGRSVTDLAIHNPENRLYVTNWLGGSLLVLDKTSLQPVKSISFSAFQGTGSGSNDCYRVSAGAAGRIVVEEQDQWVDISLFDTATGAELKTAFVREGGGGFDPTGRYYYHGENNSSGASILKFDVTGDLFTQLASVRVSSYSYYGSRTVVVTENGNGVFWNGSHFNANLSEQWSMGSEVYSASPDGRLAFGRDFVYDTQARLAVLGMPVSTSISAYNSTSRSLVVPQAGGLGIYEVSIPLALPAPELSLSGSVVYVSDPFSAGAFEAGLNWTDRSLENSFRLQQRVQGSADWSDVQSLSANVSGTTVRGLAPVTTYEFRVRASAPNLSSEWSNIVVLTTPPRPPSTPYLDAVTASWNQVRLIWRDSDIETSFVVERTPRTSPPVAPWTDTWQQIATLPANTLRYVDTGVSVGQAFAYRVKAVAGDLVSTPAVSETIVIPARTVPTSPYPLGFSFGKALRVDLNWPDVMDEDGYLLERSGENFLDWQTIATLPADATGYSDSAVTLGKTYHYRLTAFNPVGPALFPVMVGPVKVMLAETVLEDDFDPGLDSLAWAPGGAGVALGGPAGFLQGNALWFGSAGPRLRQTARLNLSEGGQVSFDFRAGHAAADGAGLWDDSETNEYVSLEYSHDGHEWFTLLAIDTTSIAARSWQRFAVPIPSWSFVESAMLRWRQNSHSGAGADVWALDNVTVTAYRSSPPVAPPAPGILVANSSSSRDVALFWSPSLAYASYVVERAQPGQAWAEIATLPTHQTYLLDSTVMPRSQYSYRVRALASGLKSAPTNISYVVTLSQQEDWLLANMGDPLALNALGQSSPDGLPHLVRYAFNLQLEETVHSLAPGGNSGLPATVLAPGTEKLRIEYLRRREATLPGITYRTEFADTPGGPWTAGGTVLSVTPVDQIWERVVVEDPLPGESGRTRFTRVVVVGE